MNPTPDLGERALIAIAIRAVTILTVVITACVTACSMHANQQAAFAISKGADPVGVACALQLEPASTCSLAAARERNH